MKDFLLALILRLGHWGYLILFLGAALETSSFLGLVVPGETIAVLGGFMAQRGLLDLGDTLGVIVAGAIIGDSVGYVLGRRLGRPGLLRFGPRIGFDAQRMDRMDELFRLKGGLAVVAGRFTAVLRAVTPFMAGSSGMRYRRFLAYNVIGGVVWATAVVLVGYLFGASWGIIDRWIGGLGTVVGAVIVVILVFFFLRKRRPRLLIDSRDGRPEREVPDRTAGEREDG